MEIGVALFLNLNNIHIDIYARDMNGGFVESRFYLV